MFTYIRTYSTKFALGWLLLLMSTQPAFANDIYLPLLSSQPAAPASSLLTNGDFEAGATTWTAASNHGRKVIRTTFENGVTPRSGSYAAWMGFYALEVSTIQQQVTVPSDKPYLSYWQWIVSADQCLRDKATLFVNNSEVDSYLLCADAQTNGWVKHVINLSAYAGQTITLTLHLKNDGDRNSNLYIDDVVFKQAQGSGDRMTRRQDDKKKAEPKLSVGQ